MMFSKEDFHIEDFGDVLKSAPIFVFIGFVAPFILAAYALGFLIDVLGWTSVPDKTLGDV